MSRLAWAPGGRYPLLEANPEQEQDTLGEVGSALERAAPAA